MRVVFMGTPDIAATCLKRILADGFEVVGVYTQPDRPKGRGMKLTASPTKQVALEAGIPVPAGVLPGGGNRGAAAGAEA